jgi:phosphoenolpyruvate-protein kinase (PTS system EI component)
MTNTELENRLSAVETELALLKNKVEQKNGTNEIAWWKQHIGIFADDPMHEEAMRLGREYRESQKPDYDEVEES